MEELWSKISGLITADNVALLSLIGTCLQAGLRALGAALLAPRIGLPGIAYACAFGWCVMLCFEMPYYFYTCKKQQP